MTTIDLSKAKDLWDWKRYARPEQLEPEGDWAIWLIQTGRGWGKTRTGAETTQGRHKTEGSIALVAPTAADARDVMVDEMMQGSGILSIAAPWDKPQYQKSNRRLVWNNGAIATIYSAEDPDQLRGPQHGFAWCDELAAWPKNTRELVWSNLMFGLRQGSSQCIVTTTPRPIPWFKDVRKRPDCVVTRGTTYDNIANLSERFIEQNIKPYEGTRLGRQELGGEILDDNPEALWSYDIIDENRVEVAPHMDVVCVAIDPAGDENGHEIGIMGAGRGAKDRHGYLLADCSLHARPEGWAEAAVDLYDDLQANYIVVERNYGGQMVASTINLYCAATQHPTIRIKEVSATRGKAVRAEPISMLDKQHQIHHVGSFDVLEDQMVDFSPGTANDRVDARVWAFTDLIGKQGAKVIAL